MNLLLTNDDGYDSPGLKALAERLSLEHKVYIVAPDSNRSAVSNHFAMFKSNSFTKISDNVYACSGYPADCTFAGLCGELFGVKMDALIAGINIGANMGTDIIYSGTCAAARQSVLMETPAIAVSVDAVDWKKAQSQPLQYEPLADFVAKNLKTLIGLNRLTFPRAFVNINGCSINNMEGNLSQYKGAKITTKLCVRDYKDGISFVDKEATAEVVGKDNKIKQSVFIPGPNHTEKEEGTDFTATREGYIAVSVVYADPRACENIDGISFSM